MMNKNEVGKGRIKRDYRSDVPRRRKARLAYLYRMDVGPPWHLKAQKVGILALLSETKECSRLTSAMLTLNSGQSACCSSC